MPTCSVPIVFFGLVPGWLSPRSSGVFDEWIKFMEHFTRHSQPTTLNPLFIHSTLVVVVRYMCSHTSPGAD